MKLDREKKGDAYILLGAVIWGFFPIITTLTFATLSPLTSLGWSTLFAAVFFAVLLTARKKWPEIRKKEALKDILMTTLLLSVVYYFFYYFGLKFTSPGNVSLIALTEIFFSFIFFQLWRKVDFPPAHIFGALLMLSGAGIVLYPNFSSFHSGDFLILAACFIAPFGNFFQQRARKNAGSEAILFVRSLFGAILIFALAAALGENVFALDLSKSFLFLLVNGFIMFGFSKIIWIEGIHRISVTKANALSAITPLLTLLFVWMIFHNAPTAFQLLAFVPMFFGVFLLGKGKKAEKLELEV
ncbi:MAG: DMT family transporter [Parcubacteria group bacterium]|jgi:drug/metabolite transporter (DMT)-like permease